MLFIDHDEWMRRTYSRFSARSPELKKLDIEIQRANAQSADDETVLSWYGPGYVLTEAGRRAFKLDEEMRALSVSLVLKAFNEWVGKRRDDWRTSVRNHDGAVTTLYNQLVYHQSKLALPATEKEAIDSIRKQRDTSIPLLFKGCEVLTKEEDLALKARKANEKRVVVQDLYTIGKVVPVPAAVSRALPSAPSLSRGGSVDVPPWIAKIADDLVKEAFGTSLTTLRSQGDSAVGLVTSALGSIKSTLMDIAPGIGLATSIGKVVKDVVVLYVSASAHEELLKVHARMPERSDPKAAIKAVSVWQEMDIARTTSALARHSANLGGQLASVLTAGGAAGAQVAIGVATAIVELTEIIADLGVQYRAKKALTRHLNDERSLDRNIFAQSPLAGAYYLLNTPTSHVALAFVDIGAPAWREEVEMLKRYGGLKTLISESARLIDASRYRIVRSDGTAFRTREDKTLGVRAKELVGKEPLRGTKKMEGFGGGG